MTLRILVTGGTFDKRYDELKGVLAFSESHLPLILKHARVTLPVTVEVTHLLDSLDMTDADRQQIVEACARAPEERIVIVHGTDTMTTTAEWLGAAALPRCIVLTGAMIPYAVADSDSLFNLGFAMAAAQLLSAGVYVAMNGRVFAWNSVHKNRERGVFEMTSEPQTAVDDWNARSTPT